MKSPLNALRTYAENQAQETREKLVTKVFGSEVVKLTVIKAVVRGQLAVKIPLGKATTEL